MVVFCAEMPNTALLEDVANAFNHKNSVFVMWVSVRCCRFLGFMVYSLNIIVLT